MATRIIPETTETTCDTCGVVCSKALGAGCRRRCGRVIIKRVALTPLGEQAGNAHKEFELCDECLDAMCEAIDAADRGIRKRQLASKGG